MIIEDKGGWRSDSTFSSRAWQGLGYFLLLILLPCITVCYLSFFVENSLTKDRQSQHFDLMAEMTAHLSRLSHPETYYQETLRRLAESFRWAASSDEIENPIVNEIAQLYLFDENGNRVAWQSGEQDKKRISEDYIKIIFKLEKNQGIVLSRREKSTASSFSGNTATAYSLAKSQGTLLNFQGLGLRKLGAFFPIILPDKSPGHLLAWINPDKINRHHLAEKAIRKLQRLAGKGFVFSWLDLNNPILNSATANLKLSKTGRDLLSTEGLKSQFVFEKHLFAHNDTRDGIRLICASAAPAPPPITETFFNFLWIIFPTLALLLAWQSIFNIKLNLSVSVQFLAIFGFTALMGFLMLIAGTMAFQHEKQNSLQAQYEQRSVEILEKIDRNFYASYGGLLRQYRHITNLLSEPSADYDDILSPLLKAQQDGKITFASFSDVNGNLVFRAPSTRAETGTIESKYASLMEKISAQILKTYNSSRGPDFSHLTEVPGVTEITSRPVESLLANRSALQNLTFDGDETMTYMNIVMTDHLVASGCLFIVHNPTDMELNYLSTAAKDIYAATGFELAAFPRNYSDRNSYFPRLSLYHEGPMWKLQDLVNQTEVACFKKGRIDGKEVLVTATPGHNIKNYNLFIIMPIAPILAKATGLANFFISGTILSIIFIAFLSIMLIKSMIHPISSLASNAIALTDVSESYRDHSFANFYSNELDSISTGLTDLIIKVREFNQGHTVKRHLLPPEPLELSWLTLDGLQIARSHEEKEIYHFSKLSDSLALLFIMRTDQTGIEASLTLSMARMAIKLISEELNVNSAFHCLKDLEEYFRINLRKNLSGDFFLATFCCESNILTYSGCGSIKLVVANRKTEVIKVFETLQTELSSRDFYNFANQEIKLDSDSFYFVFSPTFPGDCIDNLKKILPDLCHLEPTKLHNSLHDGINKICGQHFKDSASLIVGYQPHRNSINDQTS